MTKTERKRGVSVRILDVAPLEAEAIEWVRTKRIDLVDKGISRLKVGFAPWGTYEDALGNTVLVCNEGVGYLILDEEPANIGLYAEYDKAESGSKLISMMPLLEASVTQEYVDENHTGETVDLADHVRSFGNRLEQNFRNLHRLAVDPNAAREALEQWRKPDTGS